MNIFWLHPNSEQNAKYACDQHIVKMCLEYAQILCTVLRVRGSNHEELYKATHVNHPCVVWAGENYANFNTLYALLYQYGLEYLRRFNKTQDHASYSKIRFIMVHHTSLLYRAFSERDEPRYMTLPPQCMPEIYRTANPRDIHDIVAAYRRYYAAEKRMFARYRTGEIPFFMNNEYLLNQSTNGGIILPPETTILT